MNPAEITLAIGAIIAVICVAPSALRVQDAKCQADTAQQLEQQAEEDAAIVAAEVGWWRTHVATMLIP